MYQSNLNDENIKIGNWKKSTRQKDWMLRLADYEIIKINSKLLLSSDNKTNKDLPSRSRKYTKKNQKYMNQNTWNHREQASVNTKLKQQKNALVISRKNF